MQCHVSVMPIPVTVTYSRRFTLAANYYRESLAHDADSPPLFFRSLPEMRRAIVIASFFASTVSSARSLHPDVEVSPAELLGCSEDGASSRRQTPHYESERPLYPAAPQLIHTLPVPYRSSHSRVLLPPPLPRPLSLPRRAPRFAQRARSARLFHSSRVL